MNTDAMCQAIQFRMEALFGNDDRRITHALRVLQNAEAILATESCDVLVVHAAAILHDIGIHEAERKHGSAGGKYQELEGPPIARGILEDLHVDADRINHICRIVGSHHSAKDIDTVEFRIIWDADWLVNIPDEYPEATEEKLRSLIKRVFRTVKGRELAEQLFLSLK